MEPSSYTPAAVIDTDLACIECGYNLRGLSPAGRCPECGSNIDVSNRGDLLKFANPDWLKKIKLGADLMYYGIGVGILSGIGAGVLMIFLGGLGTPLIFLFTILSSLFHLVALFLITTQEPRVSLSEQQITWRRFLRVTAVVSAVAGPFNQGILSIGSAVLGILLFILTSTAGVFVTYGYFAYAETFAVRIPDPKLAKSTRIVKWALTIFQGLLAVGTIVSMVAFTAGPTGTTPAGGAGPIVVTTTPVPAPTSGPAQSPGTVVLPGPPAGTGWAPGATPGAPADVGWGGGAAPAPLGVMTGVLSCGIALPYLFFVFWALRLLLRYRKAFKLALAEATTIADAPGLIEG